MPKEAKTSYNRPEIAVAYALCAERLYAGNPKFFTEQEACVPVLVHLLYQSLEISLKHIGRHFNLWPEYAPGVKGSLDRSHDLRKVANALQEIIPKTPLRVLMSFGGENPLGANFIGRMLTAAEFEDTRAAYNNRTLAYAEINSFTIFTSNTAEWIQAVKGLAQTLEKFVGLLEQIRAFTANAPVNASSSKPMPTEP